MNVAREIGLYDAHCHPTDIMAATPRIPQMKAKALVIMATRAQDQDLVLQVAKDYPVNSKDDISKDSKSGQVVPSFGWHPWFAHQMYDDRDGSVIPGNREHYRNVLTPEPKDEDGEFLDSLPEPRSLKRFLEDTEERLLQFPLALVGEIGLDRSFRIPVAPHHSPGDTDRKTGGDVEKDYTPGSREGRSLTPFHVKMDHQKLVLKAQLELAGKHQRAVSVHSVATHGIVFDVLQSLWKGHEKLSKSALKKRRKDAENEARGEKGHVADDATMTETETPASEKPSTTSPMPFPPRICLHSYSGPPESLTQFLNPRVPAMIYFSFSQLVNFGSHNSDKAVEVIQRMPEERILIESDLHCAGETMDDLLENIFVRVCKIKEWDFKVGAETCRRNWERFVFGET